MRRWPDGVECPYCGSREYYTHTKRVLLGCANRDCRKQFSPTSGTIFDHRKIAPEKLVLALDSFAACDGPSDLMRAVHVQYKTAHSLWRRMLETDGRLA